QLLGECLALLPRRRRHERTRRQAIGPEFIGRQAAGRAADRRGRPATSTASSAPAPAAVRRGTCRKYHDCRGKHNPSHTSAPVEKNLAAHAASALVQFRRESVYISSIVFCQSAQLQSAESRSRCIPTFKKTTTECNLPGLAILALPQL